MADDADDVRLSYKITKSSGDGGYVRGFASVSSVDGKTLTDWHGDQITIETLREAAHDFVSNERVAKVMHGGLQVGEIVEAVVIDEEFAKALGMTDTRRGLWIGMRIMSDEIKKAVRDGKFTGFSIGGRGQKVDVKE